MGSRAHVENLRLSGRVGSGRDERAATRSAPDEDDVPSCRQRLRQAYRESARRRRVISAALARCTSKQDERSPWDRRAMDCSSARVAPDARHLANGQRVERHAARVPEDANNPGALNVDSRKAHEDGSVGWRSEHQHGTHYSSPCERPLQHGATVPPLAAMNPKATPARRQRAPRRAGARRTNRSRGGRRASARRS